MITIVSYNLIFEYKANTSEKLSKLNEVIKRFEDGINRPLKDATTVVKSGTDYTIKVFFPDDQYKGIDEFLYERVLDFKQEFLTEDERGNFIVATSEDIDISEFLATARAEVVE